MLIERIADTCTRVTSKFWRLESFAAPLARVRQDFLSLLSLLPLLPLRGYTCSRACAWSRTDNVRGPRQPMHYHIVVVRKSSSLGSWKRGTKFHDLPFVTDSGRVLVSAEILLHPYVAAPIGTADTDASLSLLLFSLLLPLLLLPFLPLLLLRGHACARACVCSRTDVVRGPRQPMHFHVVVVRESSSLGG